jgi:hypothetical protein
MRSASWGQLAAMAAARGQGILDAADPLAELVPIEETLAAKRAAPHLPWT